MTADLAPQEEAGRFFGLANFGTAGAAAAAGLFGPLVDWANRFSPGSGYPALFVLAALVFMASVLPLRSLPDPDPRERTALAEARLVEDRSTMEVRDAK
jgi:hypothetical protein